ncbi:MAG: hypothetical protein IPP72_18490 [Chitinophagaceae bacterium]|nr:hypothetical protein [Chitinophagaceae bacterium]
MLRAIIVNSIRVDVDHGLATTINQGDRQALVVLYNKYAPALPGIIRRVVPTESLAEDIYKQPFWMPCVKWIPLIPPANRFLPV